MKRRPSIFFRKDSVGENDTSRVIDLFFQKSNVTKCNLCKKDFITFIRGNYQPKTFHQGRALKLNSRLIKARLSGMNIYYARTSKLVLDFLSLERSLVTNSAHVACSRAGTWAVWAELVTKDHSSDKKSKTSFVVLA